MAVVASPNPVLTDKLKMLHRFMVSSPFYDDAQAQARLRGELTQTVKI
jgi:hypothetical protein